MLTVDRAWVTAFIYPLDPVAGMGPSTDGGEFDIDGLVDVVVSLRHRVSDEAVGRILRGDLGDDPDEVTGLLFNYRSIVPSS